MMTIIEMSDGGHSFGGNEELFLLNFNPGSVG